MKRIIFIFLFLISQVHADCIPVGILGEFKTTTSKTSYAYGKEMFRGVEIASKSDLKHCFKFEKIDINNNIANIDGLIRKYRSQGIKYFIGLGTSEQTHAATKAINETNSYLISPTATDDAILKNSSSIILLSSPNSQLAKSIIKQAEQNGIKEIAIIHGKNNVYSQSMAQLLKEATKDSKIKVSYEAGVRIGRSTQIEGLDNNTLKKVDAIILPVFELDAVKILGHLNKHQINTKVIGTDSWGSNSKIILSLPEKVRNNVLFSITTYDVKDKSVQGSPFYKSYIKDFSQSPSDTSAFSYEALKVLDSMLKDCDEKSCPQSFQYAGTTGLVKIENNVANRDIYFKKL